MRRFVPILAALLPACNPEPGDRASDSAGEASSAASLGASSTGAPGPTTGEATTGAPVPGTSEPAPPDDGLGEYGPCPQGNECERCVQTEDGSICGPRCHEYGPGWAPGRCPETAVQRSTLCPLDHAQNTGDVCLIRCGDAAPCPDPKMLCVACPEPFVFACASFADWPDGGPGMCIWPAA